MTNAERKQALGTQINSLKAQRDGLQTQLNELDKGILRIEGAILLLNEMEAEAASAAKAAAKAEPAEPSDG